MNYIALFCLFFSYSCHKENLLSRDYKCHIKGSSQIIGSTFNSWEYIDTITLIQNNMRLNIEDHFKEFLNFKPDFELSENKFYYLNSRTYANGYFVSDSLYYTKCYQGPSGSNDYMKNDCKCKKL